MLARRRNPHHHHHHREDESTVEEVDGEDRDCQDLPEDMWGVFIMVLCRDAARLRAGEPEVPYHKLRLFYAAFAQGVNLSLQIGVLWFVKLYVVDPAQTTMQYNYYSYHRDVFEKTGELDGTEWRYWTGPIQDLCESALGNTMFTFIILLVWMVMMVGEIRSSYALYEHVSHLDPMPKGASLAQMIWKKHATEKNEETGEEEPTDEVEEEYIIFMDRFTKMAIYCLVIIPKVSVSLALTGMGFVWFVATESFGDLILNVLALEFIILIDDNILLSFFPKSMLDDIGMTKFSYPKKDERTEDEELQHKLMEYAYSTMWLLGSCLCICLYLFGLPGVFSPLQQVLPGYNHDIAERCDDPRNTNRYHPECNVSLIESLRLGAEAVSEACFPYGTNPVWSDNYDRPTPIIAE